MPPRHVFLRSLRGTLPQLPRQLSKTPYRCLAPFSSSDTPQPVSHTEESKMDAPIITSPPQPISITPNFLREPKLSKKVRSLMRLVPHHLTIIHSGYGRLKTGFLASSFNVVTLKPEPYVSFNIRVPSTSYSRIARCGVFYASLLNSATTADIFSQASSASEEDKKKLAIKDVLDNEDALKGGVWWMCCQVLPHLSSSVGDHKIVVGKVLQAGTYPTRVKENILLYLNRTYMQFPHSEADIPDLASQPPPPLQDFKKQVPHNLTSSPSPPEHLKQVKQPRYVSKHLQLEGEDADPDQKQEPRFFYTGADPEFHVDPENNDGRPVARRGGRGRGNGEFTAASVDT